MGKSKTKWKRVLSVLLVTAMVLTGNAFSSMEVKAAEVTDETAADLVGETTEAAGEGTEETGAEASGETVAETEEKEKTVESTDESVVKNDEIGNDTVNSSEISENENNEIALDVTGGEYGELQNGDFEGSDISPWVANHSSGVTAKTEKNEYGVNNTTHYYNIYVEESAAEPITINFSQEVKNIKAGKYKVSLKIAGEAEDTLTVCAKTETETLASKNLGSAVGWDTWNTVETDEFEVSEGANITVEISGTLAKGKYVKLDDITFTMSGYTMDGLKALYANALTLQESDYTADSWTTFAGARDAAGTLIESTESVTEEEIANAYKALQETMDGLVSKNITATLYYYTEAAQEEVGVVAWSGGIISYGEQVTKAGWTPWEGTDCYLMEKTDYPGWYSIDLTFANSGAGSGFEIYTASKDEGDGYTVSEKALYVCADDKEENNQAVYQKLISGTAASYAVKNGNIYAGDDVTAVQRNITLYVYDDTNIPAIMVNKEKSKLLYADESTGTVKELPVDESDDGYGNYLYTMVADEIGANWYSLTFSVPTAGTDGVVCKLYKKTVSGETITYTWLKDFVNNETAKDYEADITPVFSGSVYYKDGVFGSEKPEVVITLGMLKALVASEEVTAITEKGESNYTESSWNAFKTALDTANALVATYGTADVTTEAEDITAAYTALHKAVKEIIENAITVTFHYYVEDANIKPLFAYWGNGGEDISTTAAVSEQYLWNAGDAYDMTPSPDYPGWYSIEITFSKPGADSGFDLYSCNKETGKANTNKGEELFKCSAEWNNTDIYAKLISGEATSYAVKGGKLYTGDDVTALQRNITLYVYDDTGIPVIMSEKAELSYVDESTGTVQKLTADNYNDGNQNYYYSMTADAVSKNWYYLTFSVPEVETGNKAFQLYQKTGSGETAAYKWIMNFINGGTADQWSVDMTPVFSGNIYYKDGVLNADKGKASGLEELIAEAEKYVKDDYEEKSWAAFVKALADAKAVAAKENPTNEEIEAATKALTEAMAALVYATEAEVNVQKVFLSDDFITGADLSSYVSLVESGVVFKDENGNPLSDSEFFKAVAAGGTNWIRIRLWDNPYDSNGNGYGGGNNDINKAITLAKLADGAGMKVLLDFHYSDFWVDPSKYAAPKAWENMTLEEKEKALYDHTYNSLVKLHDAGVDVGMVQVGNETNSGIAGETDKTKMARLFNSGSKAVRDFSEKYLGKRDAVMVALHFTDPQDGYGDIAKNLDENGVDYDVFASSYYPYWHESHTAAGDTRSLTAALGEVASTYGKKVMVAETSWATTWEDGDGHDNSAPKTSGQNLQYDISVQGQVDEMRAVVAAVNSIPNGIGVFYWEPAWIPVGYAYNDDGSINQEQLKANKELWEKYGSGWASSYSAEYDPNDAGKWYGGSAVDNQSWFDFDGTALASLNAYRYMRSGTSAKLAISYVPKSVETSTFVGDTVKYPATVQAKFNNGTTADYPVVWDSDQMALVSTDKVGEYYVDGMVTCTYTDGEQKTVTEKYAVTLTIKVQPMASSNQLENAGFETVENDAAKGWTVKYVTKAADGTETESTSAPAGSEYTVKPTIENPYSGSYGMNFYRGDAGISIRVCQEITGLDAGTYDFGGYIQGGSTGGDDLSYSYVKIYSLGENGERVLEASYKSQCALSGWLNWSKPEVSGFVLQAGQIIEVGFEINSSVAGSWGSIDDAYLYGSYGASADPDLKNGVITLSDTVARVGEKVRFVVTPDDGYVVDDADISVYRLGGENQETKIPVTDCGLEVKDAQGAFIMPGYPVYVTAKIKSIEEIAGGNAEGKIKLEDVTFAPVKAQIYTGKDIKPSIMAAYKTYTLTEKKDYTLEYANNKEAGTAKITVTGTGSFTGTKELTFDIKKATSLKDAEITISGGDSVDNKGVQCFLYTGGRIYADVKVEAAGTAAGTKVTLKEGEDYILSFSNNTKVGTATVYIVANENNAVYSGTGKKTFKIVKPDLGVLDQNGAIVVTPPSGTTYTGKAVKPNITIKYGTMTLRKGVDYTVSYSKNKTVSYDPQNSDEVVAAGVLTVKGKGSFTGKFTREFKISPKSLQDANVKATAKAMTYKNGNRITPSVSVTAGDTKLKLNRDFKITAYEKWNAEKENGAGYEPIEASQITEMGTYRLTLTGQKNYQGEVYAEFRVVDKAHNIENAKIKVQAKDFTGKAIMPTPGTAEDSELCVYFDPQSPLAYGTDYTVAYDNNIKAGKKAKVTIIGQGDYAGEKTASFTINAVDISKLANEAFSAQITPDDTLGTVQYYTGYALKPEYTVKAALQDGNGTNTVTLIKNTDYTISFGNNVSGKKQADGTYLATVKIKGKGNFKGTYTDTFEVTPTKLSDFNISVNTVTYSGKAQKPPITFIHKATGKTFDLKAGTAYTAVYKNTTNIGNPSSKAAPNVTIKEKGLNPNAAKADKQTLEPIYFSITSARIDASCIADIKIQSYSGKAVKPKLTVKVNGRTLKLGKDYTVKYEDNTLRGKASVTVTGIGNYAGSAEKGFVIK